MKKLKILYWLSIIPIFLITIVFISWYFTRLNIWWPISFFVVIFSILILIIGLILVIRYRNKGKKSKLKTIVPLLILILNIPYFLLIHSLSQYSIKTDWIEFISEFETCESGIKKAYSDIDNGKMILIYCSSLTSEPPEPLYRLREDYKIKMINVGHLWKEGFDCYNNIMISEIETKYGIKLEHLNIINGYFYME